MKNKGLYIIFEGIDGCGKGTQIERFQGDFDKLTREPGSQQNGTCQSIRKILLHGEKKNHITTRLLFLADANEHLSNVVKPYLDSGCSVLSDRCMVSDLAYAPDFNNPLRDAILDNFRSLNPFIIFLDVSPEVALKRMTDRGELNQYEIEKVVHRLPELRENYIKALVHYPCAIINADVSIEEVYEQINGILIKLEEQRKCRR